MPLGGEEVATDPAQVARLWEANAPAWIALSRAGWDLYRDHLNTPAFLRILPPVGGLRGLDIGCGEATNSRTVAARGARITALDVAPSFLAAAAATEAADPRGIRFVRGSALALPFPDGTFDFATSFMCLMDVPHPDRALTEAARILRPGGFLQFSILHPSYTGPGRRVLRDAEGTAYAIELREATLPDGTVERWRFSSAPPALRDAYPPFQVPRFDRSLAWWLNAVACTGLHLEAAEEPIAEPELAARVPTIADTRIAPLFLILRARKPLR
ncbi:class I SAM-dependent methyltransferase [Roseomonas eburnea]|uniref:Class I SAM-dependent methyltransferase n=1 Tax=Neoroseomonas eburnea TaxID=1346889 RepID=A0A9X9XK09_9PROT|nr:class I SAM-dependent methyltransferase [Neoroseomonas eburnea]MBR0684045.1 class I SAM-dependent methyltransferase [Neoroseomonas eburnea]